MYSRTGKVGFEGPKRTPSPAAGTDAKRAPTSDPAASGRVTWNQLYPKIRVHQLSGM